MRAAALSLCFAALGLAAAAHAAPRPAVPPAECRAHVGYDLDADLPGYRIASGGGPAECVPFTPTEVHPPKGYRGDFYVDAFTDARLRARWAACKAEPACLARLAPHIAARLPPNKDHRPMSARALYLLGRIDVEGPADLKAIRRPAFFAQAPYAEPIAAAEPRTFTVEFTTGREPYEQAHGLAGPVMLRGWYVRGAGFARPDGRRVRALVIMSAGGGGRIAAIEDPSDRLYRIDPATGRSILNHFPNATTGAAGERTWRLLMWRLNQAGFDVLSYDRRGVGVSSGLSDTDTVQQGRDILRVVGELATGEGLRALAPTGETLAGPAAARALRGGDPARPLPVLLLGSSRGTMATGFAMTRNFDRACEFEQPVVTCGPPARLAAIKGAIMLSDYSAGPGYITSPTDEEDADRILFTAGTEVEHRITFFPSSAILAGMSRWPAVFIGRGAWDYAESLEGAMAAYDRVRGPKELVVVRAPHPIETWPASEQARVTRRIVAFAEAAVLGRPRVEGGRAWTDMKSLLATSDPVWEPSSAPAGAR